MKIWAILLAILVVASLAFFGNRIVEEELTTAEPLPLTTTAEESTTNAPEEETSTSEDDFVTGTTQTPTESPTFPYYCGTTCYDLPGCITITDSWHTTCECTYICDTTTEAT